MKAEMIDIDKRLSAIHAVAFESQEKSNEVMRMITALSADLEREELRALKEKETKHEM